MITQVTGTIVRVLEEIRRLLGGKAIGVSVRLRRV